MTDIENQIGKKFADLRKNHLKLTQKEIAKDFGISAMMISKYETGKAKITVSILIQFCVKYKLPPTLFFADFITNKNLSKDLEILLDRANALNESDQKKLVETLNLLLNGFEKK